MKTNLLEIVYLHATVNFHEKKKKKKKKKFDGRMPKNLTELYIFLFEYHSCNMLIHKMQFTSIYICISSETHFLLNNCKT